MPVTVDSEIRKTESLFSRASVQVEGTAMLTDNLQGEDRMMGEQRRAPHPALVKGRDGIFHGLGGHPHSALPPQLQEMVQPCCAYLFQAPSHSPCCRDSV